MCQKKWVVSGCLQGAAAVVALAGFMAPAASDEPLQLCRQDVNGRPEIFACREYSDAGNRYLLLFKDSPFPRVMVLHRGNPGTARVRPIDSAATGPQAHPESVFLDADRAGYH